MRRIGMLVTGVLLLAAHAASAQDTSKGEVSAGWRYYHATINSSVSLFGPSDVDDFSRGWYADVSGNLSPKFAIVGEVGGTYHSTDSEQTSGSITTREEHEITFHTFMGGVRVRAPQNSRLVPFGQVLFGGQRNTSSYVRTMTFNFTNVNIPPSRTELDAEGNGAALALDGGLTIAAGWIGVRAQGGYVRMFGETDADAFRFSLGGVYRF